MTSLSNTSTQPAARKHDGEIITARSQAAWLSCEAGIHQNDTLRTRISRALDRFGLGSSTAAVDEALDYLTNKELGQSARYFNQTGKAQFNQQQITHAVLSFMAGKEQQRHITDLAIQTDDTDHDDDTPGSVRACHMADPGHSLAGPPHARRRTVPGAKKISRLTPLRSSAAQPCDAEPHVGPDPAPKVIVLWNPAIESAQCRFGGFSDLETLVIIGCDQMSSGLSKRVLRQSSDPNSPLADLKINTLTPQCAAVSDIIAAKYRRWVVVVSNILG